MPSKLINHTLSSITAGVTQQYQEGRFENQVSGMVNCMPSLTRGILRRNPIDTSFQLYKDVGGTTPLNTTDAFTYSYDRGTGTEQYLIVITNGTTVATNCEMYVYNINNTDGIPLLVTAPTYLVITAGAKAKDSFTMLTIGDVSFVLNKTKVVAMGSTTAPGASELNNWAFYWIKKTTGIVIEQKQTGTDPATLGSRLEGYQYSLNGKTVVSEEVSSPLSARADADPIYYATSTQASSAASKLASVLSLSSKYSFVYTKSTPSSWEWSDTYGNDASLGVWKAIDSATKLPVDLPLELDGFIVEVSGGTAGDEDDYYLKYIHDKRTWEEVAKPGEVINLDTTTMPHAIYRLANGTFIFDEYKNIASDGLSVTTSAWSTRDVGDTASNEQPSFVGNPISNMFFHRNRLGFITKDSISLSSTGEYGKFFDTTVQKVLDDDRIDLAVATTEVTIVRQAVSAAGNLLLFADDAQFVLTSGEGFLTPSSASIIDASNYTYNKNVPAKSIGNKVYFTSISGGYTQVYAYKLTDRGAQVTEAVPLSLHVPSYIDSSSYDLVGHDVLGYNFILSSVNKKQITVLTHTIIGTEDLQNAFHTWTFEEDIEGITIINNDLYILFKSGSLNRLKLEIPGTIDSITYGDIRPDSTYYDYGSSVEFSQFFWRNSDGKGTSRDRLQLRTLQYTITDNSFYETIIYNSNLRNLLTTNDFGPVWPDTDVWSDALNWADIDPLYYRTYKNDSKVTVMSDTKYAEIVFKSSSDSPLKGFELATVNAEMLYHQRSSRV